MAAKRSGQVLLRKDKDIGSHMRNTVTGHVKLYTAFEKEQRAASDDPCGTIMMRKGLRMTTATNGMVFLSLVLLNVLLIIWKKATLTRYIIYCCILRCSRRKRLRKCPLHRPRGKGE